MAIPQMRFEEINPPEKKETKPKSTKKETKNTSTKSEE